MSVAVQAPAPAGGVSLCVAAAPDLGFVHAGMAPVLLGTGGCSVITQPGSLPAPGPAGCSTVVAPAGGLSIAVAAAPDGPPMLRADSPMRKQRHSVPARLSTGAFRQVSCAGPFTREALAERNRAATDGSIVVLTAPPPQPVPVSSVRQLPPAPPVQVLSHSHTPQLHSQATISDLLDQIVKPGDILYSKADAPGFAVGAAGGLMGHVSVVLAPPQRVLRGSLEAWDLSPAWPRDDVQELWRVKTMESTSEEKGLYQTETLLYVEPFTRRLQMIGDLTQLPKQQILGIGEDEVPVELWQSPSELRAMINPSIVAQVVAEMQVTSRNWSARTAMRALFLSTHSADTTAIHDMKEAWYSAPICTSVAIAFWQRYICKIAELSGGTRNAADLISRYMPLRADRTLPDDLLNSLWSAGWNQQQFIFAGARLPLVGIPAPAPQLQQRLHASASSRVLPTFAAVNRGGPAAPGSPRHRPEVAPAQVLVHVAPVATAPALQMGWN
mmetsp:Transcript_12894/g.30189  ORF Transcript_12894/g.30189 Transcript_12894/m.30189 type:complete len:498 (-) Transcript_12894:220-1713(-)|eukprot:CAMPEP_0178389268 /NCGR_PEP_ID=MMETSP0689_2-20121128/10027_1 /TAXON_ID=160604 /ORGANISM="Amphidinium massartii, Strain CS-259" /LENGTH=497 /DNA_ID=CAMNT_0020009709 /DNA_START=32 /DNA_END=1525 /DNA_ORIENTATION=+